MTPACNPTADLSLFSKFRARCSMFDVRCLVFTLFLAFCSSLSGAPPEGILPTDKSGHSLNLDFETGTLQDWIATGAAFDKQPIKGDTVSSRRGDMRSQH